MGEKATFEKKDGSSLKIGIISARWNGEFCKLLFDKCKQGLLDSGLKEENIRLVSVPGAYELVYGAAQMIDNEKVDAVVCIGVLLKGETMHFEYIANAVSYGIMELNLKKNIPVIFGVLTCLDEGQLKVRTVGEKNHGYDWGLSAVEMALLKKGEASKMEKPERI